MIDTSIKNKLEKYKKLMIEVINGYKSFRNNKNFKRTD